MQEHEEESHRSIGVSRLADPWIRYGRRGTALSSPGHQPALSLEHVVGGRTDIWSPTDPGVLSNRTRDTEGELDFAVLEVGLRSCSPRTR